MNPTPRIAQSNLATPAGVPPQESAVALTLKEAGIWDKVRESLQSVIAANTVLAQVIQEEFEKLQDFNRDPEAGSLAGHDEDGRDIGPTTNSKGVSELEDSDEARATRPAKITSRPIDDNESGPGWQKENPDGPNSGRSPAHPDAMSVPSSSASSLDISGLAEAVLANGRLNLQFAQATEQKLAEINTAMANLKARVDNLRPIG